MRLSLSFVAVLLGSTFTLQAQPLCNLNIPLAPDPVPPGFDYRPLAENWCKQLATCGFPLPNCVDVYLAAVASAETLVAAPPDPVGANTATFTLVCEQSEEFRADPNFCTPTIPDFAATPDFTEGLLADDADLGPFEPILPLRPSIALDAISLPLTEPLSLTLDPEALIAPTDETPTVPAIPNAPSSDATSD